MHMHMHMHTYMHICICITGLPGLFGPCGLPMHKYTGQFLAADKECHRRSPHVQSTGKALPCVCICIYAYMHIYICIHISGQRGSAAQGAVWPRLAEARGSLEHDLALKEAPGEYQREQVGRCLSHQVLFSTSVTGPAVPTSPSRSRGGCWRCRNLYYSILTELRVLTSPEP